MISKKIEKIKNDFEELGSVVIAFSGGIDSSVTAYLAHEAVGDNALAITADSETLPDRELEKSKKIADEIGINHKIISLSEFNDPNFSENDLNRCYYCKRELFSNLKKFANKNGYEKVADGTNTSEIQAHRPGYKAVKELDVYSPLAKYDLEKEDVRKIAKEKGLSIYNKPSMACLASRISHEESITPHKLDMVEKAEDILYDMGFRQFRVRKHGDLARIELPKDERGLGEDEMDKLVDEFKELGFRYVTLDIEGYRSGSMEKL